MKIEQAFESFRPITITLESRADVESFKELARPDKTRLSAPAVDMATRLHEWIDLHADLD